MATTKAPRKKKEQIKRPDLKIGIKDFGPIAEGEIELKPLTVFIGPNNSGKSYAAMLIYSIFRAFIPESKDMPFLYLSPDSEENMVLMRYLSELKAIVDDMNIGDERQIPNELLLKIVNEMRKSIYERKLGNEISDFFSCKLDKLVALGKEKFSLNIGTSSYKDEIIYYHEGKLVVDDLQQTLPSNDIRVRLNYSTNSLLDKKSKVRVISFIADGRIMFHIPLDDKITEFELGYIAAGISVKMPQYFLTLCYYLPSARSGMIQLYRTIMGGIIEQYKSFAMNPFAMDRQAKSSEFAGVALRFVSSIISLPKEKGYFYQFAEKMEEELIKGNISAKFDVLPDIKYKFQDTEIQLQRASTSVTEIAPLILYLKYIIQPGSVLIIEEPEAHLHPANIRILAKYLVRLVNKGVNVLITTHSDYLLEQINNLYLLSKIDPEERVVKFHYEKDDYLNRDELGVYEFHYDEEAKGYKIKQAEIDEDGILEREIYSITEDLYEETSQLQRESSDEE